MSNLEESNQGQVEQVSFGSVQHNLANIMPTSSETYTSYFIILLMRKLMTFVAFVKLGGFRNSTLFRFKVLSEYLKKFFLMRLSVKMGVNSPATMGLIRRAF